MSPAGVEVAGHRLTAADCTIRMGVHDLWLHQYHHLGAYAGTHPLDGRYWATCSCDGPRQAVADPEGDPWCRTYAEVFRLARRHLAVTARVKPEQLALF